jgi:uncharacterized protein YqhQ
MMRAPTSLAVARRRRDGSNHIRERAMKDSRTGWAKLPFVRGVASLVESLTLGSEALRFAVEQLEKDLEAEEAEQAPKKKSPPSAPMAALLAFGVSLFAMATRAPGDPVGEPAKKRGLGPMLLLPVLVLIALPQGAAAGLNRVLHLGLDVQSPGFQALTGLFKLSIVVGLMTAFRRIPDMRRMFQYHGAEHKTISTYEAGEELTVANARGKTTLHPRCGTTFLVMVVLVSILLFTAIGAFLPRIDTGSAIGNNVVFFLEKLPFLPALAAVTFELQRLFARYCTTGPLRALLWPGFLVQKITTIEPDDAQLEIALASLRATLFREQGVEQGEEAREVAFPDYATLSRAPALT